MPASELDEVNPRDFSPTWKPEFPAWEGLVALPVVFEVIRV